MYDLQKNPGNHSFLMNGGEYEYDGHMYIHYGLKHVLSMYAMARFQRYGQYISHAYTTEKKRSYEGENISNGEEQQLYNSRKQSAFFR